MNFAMKGGAQLIILRPYPDIFPSGNDSIGELFICQGFMKLVIRALYRRVQLEAGVYSLVVDGEGVDCHGERYRRRVGFPRNPLGCR